jgi:hypothetical protein
MVARCFGSTPPPASRAADLGTGMRAEPEVTLAPSAPQHGYNDRFLHHHAPLLGEDASHSCGGDRALFERTTRCAS